MVSANGRSASGDGAEHSYVDLGDSARVALMISPQGRGAFTGQVHEVLSRLVHVLEEQPQPMAVTVQTVFLREAGDQEEWRAVVGGLLWGQAAGNQLCAAAALRWRGAGLGGLGNRRQVSSGGALRSTGPGCYL